MLWKQFIRSAVACAALGLFVAGCGDSRSGSDVTAPTDNQADRSSAVHDADMVYDQVDFLGNPLVSEVTIVKANHEQYNKTQPYNSATFRPQTEAFVNTLKAKAKIDILM